MIDRLTTDDLDSCLALAQDRDWPPERHKWRLLFDVGTVYGVRDDGGAVIATTILTRYGDLASISMVLVARHHERRGIGGALMAHAIAEAGGSTVFLNATEYGRPLYERLGFVTVGRTFTHIGHFTGAGDDRRRPEAGAGERASRLATPADLGAIHRLDTEVNGADRKILIDRLPAFATEVRAVEVQGAIIGYGAMWPNHDNTVIGPVVAETPQDARALIADLAAGVEGPIRLDLDDRHPELHGWAVERGLEPRTSTVVMAYGGTLPGDRRRWFVPMMQALG
ncbi:GNAT family N-acetyltransferase [Phytohabitans flavus]|uniref:Acetyltransferase n=1 Tax=Phytohabitans flavus TaxID=1076124 RepID=A0A6F8Y762_9ACTN|nr:GNAT family N-acetyltransferase [Phytohabitans flavus]BCB81935.1 acetyltransferase [Phytohabitans flavus]